MTNVDSLDRLLTERPGRRDPVMTTELAVVRPDCPLSAPSVGVTTLWLACALAE
jgi:hypothetical protein